MFINVKYERRRICFKGNAMKIILVLSFLLSFNLTQAQDANEPDLAESSGAIVESEDVDGLELEAPEGYTDAELDSSEEASFSSESKAEEKTASEITKAAAVTPATKQATTEEILAEKGMVDSKPAAKNAIVDMGDVVGKQKYKITCTLNDDTREIVAIEQDDGSVGVVYTKFGETKTIALAKTDPSYADQVADKIYNNLANGQYPYACTKQ